MNEQTIHVLLVEDEETLALIIKDTLEGQGFCIRLAKDGKEGLGRFFEEKPDVLVADVMMPRMDGFEMVRRIRDSKWCAASGGRTSKHPCFSSPPALPRTMW